MKTTQTGSAQPLKAEAFAQWQGQYRLVTFEPSLLNPKAPITGNIWQVF